MTSVDTRVRRRRSGSWEQAALSGLEWVANPALAGAAFVLLGLAVVTWLPALAATAQVLYRWRSEGEQRCFLGVFAAFGGYWRAMWRQSLISTAVTVVLLINVGFLARQSTPVALVFLAMHLGIAAAMVPYHLGLAALAGRSPGASQYWWRQALVLGFGGWRGPILLAATAAAVLFTLPLAVGPFLFGPTAPLLLALRLADRITAQPPGRDAR
jgi:hypothetical protein